MTQERHDSKTRNHKNRDKTLTLYNLTQRHTGKG